MLKTFGDLLCKEYLPENDGSVVLPSPNQLKRKILVKAKTLPPPPKEGEDEVEGSSSMDLIKEEEDSDVEDELDPTQVPGFSISPHLFINLKEKFKKKKTEHLKHAN